MGPDCDIIGGLLYRFGDKFILSALEDGEYAIAVEHYLQLLDSLTTHFIADEHWCWFDDFYSPDYTVSHMGRVYSPPPFRRPGRRVSGRTGIRHQANRTNRSLSELRHSVYDSVFGLEECKDISGAVRKSQSRYSEITCPPAGGQMGVKWGCLGDVLAGFPGSVIYS